MTLMQYVFYATTMVQLYMIAKALGGIYRVLRKGHVDLEFHNNDPDMY